MRKIKTAFVVIFAASLVMMAFTVIPHHHHSDRICFERFHTNHEDRNHDSNDCNNPYHCILHQVVESQSENIITLKSPYLLSANSSFFNFLQNALPVELHFDDPVRPLLFFLPETDFNACSYTKNPAPALRAPPQI
jgi:hypothetical protein